MLPTRRVLEVGLGVCVATIATQTLAHPRGGASVACAFPIVPAVAIAWLISGQYFDPPTGSVDYIDLPVFAAIVLVDEVTAPIEARNAPAMSVAMMSRAFAMLLHLPAAYMCRKWPATAPVHLRRSIFLNS
ncbi:MAG: hypothetical protein KJZ83_08360 [Burkholderiaceae bacterium]|nr:hypothetical protein [Burkholderiaceae bacterium]